MKTYYVYILECSDKSYYIGVTNNLERRLYEHSNKIIKGYTSTRLPISLKYFQEYKFIQDALNAEKQLKGWSRAKKKALIDQDSERLVLLSKSKHPSTGSG